MALIERIEPESPTGLKLLCLPGFSQSPTVFRSANLALMRYLTGLGITIGGDTYAWWFNIEGQEVQKRAHQEASVQHVLKHMEKEKYDALLGFSQGGALASIVTYLFTQDKLPVEFPELRNLYLSSESIPFLPIICGSYLPQDYLLQFPEFTKPSDLLFKIPSLHFIGERDTIVLPERSEELTEVFDPSQLTVFRHPGAHFIPYTQKACQLIGDFILGTKKEEN